MLTPDERERIFQEEAARAEARRRLRRPVLMKIAIASGTLSAIVVAGFIYSSANRASMLEIADFQAHPEKIVGSAHGRAADLMSPKGCCLREEPAIFRIENGLALRFPHSSGVDVWCTAGPRREIVCEQRAAPPSRAM